MSEPNRSPPDENAARAARLFLAAVRGRFAVREAWLFGSRARGTARGDSDADIALVIDGPQGEFVPAKLALDDVAYDVLLETGVHIQPLPLWVSQWDDPSRFTNPGLVRAVKRDGVLL